MQVRATCEQAFKARPFLKHLERLHLSLVEMTKHGPIMYPQETVSVKAEVRGEPLEVGWRKLRVQPQVTPRGQRTVLAHVVDNDLRLFVTEIRVAHQFLERCTVEPDGAGRDLVQREPARKPRRHVVQLF